ncbi:exported hypothetical protein [Tenacibaculum sediminilitoris]|uniref:hypothetical protein n=1 Tax=Tenacibaculum sediminilitoris TaxID=1820334 RepID=UPI00389355A6
MKKSLFLLLCLSFCFQIKAQSVSNTSFTTSGAGWFQVGKWTSTERGSARVVVSLNGGNHAPQSVIIDAFKNWSTGLQVDIKGILNTYIQKVRITNDANYYYLEAYFNRGITDNATIYLHEIEGRSSGFTLNSGLLPPSSGSVLYETGDIIKKTQLGNSLDVRKDLFVKGKVEIVSSGGSWISGKTGSGGITSSTQLTSNAYYSLIRQKTSSGHTISMGGLGDSFGFFGYDKDRVENGYDHSMVMNLNTGNVGIGITSPSTKLEIRNGTLKVSGGSTLGQESSRFVVDSGNSYGHSLMELRNINGVMFKVLGNGNAALNGKFESKEIKVTTTPTADFVFEESYSLPTLKSIEKHIKEKRHLPEIASAKEMKQNGVNIGNFQIQLLQKIEELTLYTIQQEKKINSQKSRLEQQNSKLVKLESYKEQLEQQANEIAKLKKLVRKIIKKSKL